MLNRTQTLTITQLSEFSNTMVNSLYQERGGEEEVVLATLVVQIDLDVNLAVVMALLVLLVLRIEVHFAV